MFTQHLAVRHNECITIDDKMKYVYHMAIEEPTDKKHRSKLKYQCATCQEMFQVECPDSKAVIKLIRKVA